MVEGLVMVLVFVFGWILGMESTKYTIEFTLDRATSDGSLQPYEEPVEQEEYDYPKVDEDWEIAMGLRSSYSVGRPNKEEGEF